MQHNTGLELQTDRLILRELREEDWLAVHDYASDPEVVKYMAWGPNTGQDTQEFIHQALLHQKEQPRMSYDFGLVNKSDNLLIGACGLSIRNAKNKEAEIGYVLNRRHWKQGYMTEAAGMVVSFGFEQLGLHRIIATCALTNIASYRVMEKIGMRKEGYLRENMLMRGEWRDSLLYSILKKK